MNQSLIHPLVILYPWISFHFFVISGRWPPTFKSFTESRISKKNSSNNRNYNGIIYNTQNLNKITWISMIHPWSFHIGGFRVNLGESFRKSSICRKSVGLHADGHPSCSKSFFVTITNISQILTKFGISAGTSREICIFFRHIYHFPWNSTGSRSLEFLQNPSLI